MRIHVIKKNLQLKIMAKISNGSWAIKISRPPQMIFNNHGNPIPRKTEKILLPNDDPTAMSDDASSRAETIPPIVDERFVRIGIIARSIIREGTVNMVPNRVKESIITYVRNMRIITEMNVLR